MKQITRDVLYTRVHIWYIFVEFCLRTSSRYMKYLLHPCVPKRERMIIVICRRLCIFGFIGKIRFSMLYLYIRVHVCMLYSRDQRCARNSAFKKELLYFFPHNEYLQKTQTTFRSLPHYIYIYPVLRIIPNTRFVHVYKYIYIYIYIRNGRRFQVIWHKWNVKPVRIVRPSPPPNPAAITCETKT